MNTQALLKNGLVYWVGRLISRSVSFLLLPVYTSFILPADWGMLNILFVTGDLLGIIVILQLPSALFRYWAESANEQDRRRLAFMALSTPLIFSTILFIPGYTWAGYWAHWLGIGAHPEFIRIMLLTQQLAIAVEIMQAEMRLRDKAGRYAVLEIAQNFSIAGFSILFVAAFRLNAIGVLMGQLAAFAIMCVIMAPAFLRRVEWAWDSSRIGALAKFAVPLVFSALAMAVIHSVDRYFIQRMLGVESVGIYSIAHRFGSMVTIVFLSPFLLLWDPKSYALAKQANASDRFGKIATYVVAVLGFITLGIAAAANELAGILTAPAYHKSAALIAPLALAYAIYSLDPLLRFGLFWSQKTRIVLLVVVASCLVTVAGNFILLPLIGLAGAAWATLAAFATLVALDYTFARRYFRYTFEWGKLAFIGVTAVSVFALASSLHLNNIWLNLGAKAGVCAAYPFALILGVFQEERATAFAYVAGKIRNFRAGAVGIP
jgi:O-antigen/teichoic acid export membrane protein